ncbi:MAG TPA: hypothetical protein VGF61_25135 [Candidatus Acidoferrum sp.]|jgi:hypothetical protein
MNVKQPGLAQFLTGPTAPAERITLPKSPTPREADFEGLAEWNKSLDRYAHETAGGGRPAQVLDFKTHTHFLKDLISRRPFYLWPDDLYIPGNADYKNYWPWPCPADHRYGREWISGNDVNQASAKEGHVWAYTALNQYMPHTHSEAGIGFLFTPTAKLAVYSVKPSISALGTYRWSISTTYYGGGWIYEWGVIYIAAWNINPADGKLELVTPYGVTTVFNESFNNLGTQAITNVVPPWSPGAISTNLLLEGGKSYLIGIIAAVDVTNTWNVPQGKWPDGSDWLTWCTLDLMVPQINIDATTIYQP